MGKKQRGQKKSKEKGNDQQAEDQELDHKNEEQTIDKEEQVTKLETNETDICKLPSKKQIQDLRQMHKQIKKQLQE